MTENLDPAAATTASAPTATRAPRRLLVGLFALAAFVIAADQLSKWWAEANLGDGKNIPIIGDLLSFQLVYNPGAAFSLAEEYTWVLTIIAAIAVVAITWYSLTVQSRAWAVALGMLLGGAITHLGDRLFRDPGFARGHVVDFINYNGYFIGNIADIALVGGAIMIVVISMMGIAAKPERVAATPEAEADAAAHSATNE
ncbi:signal peptidase II [Salinibacterium sp. SWN1162]|uniref:signal peptidase II n=1 Tax=Salinibacterium sp. SWN1162 TaxID=2792053 RepID=UPI001E2F0BC8|nr:signal peptidase II [Salinibacterium sp. SWN1162]